MKKQALGYFFIATSLFITNIFFIFLSIFGLEYNGKESGGPIFMISVLGVNFVAILFILSFEMRYHRYAMGKVWPYWIPFFYLMFYSIESLLGNVGYGDRAGSTIRDVVAVTSLGMWSGVFGYRYHKFKEIVENIEVIMLASTVALIFALPTMFLSGLGVSIGGAGDHQIVSYIAAVGFGFTVCRLRFKPNYGYLIFNSSIYRKVSPIIAFVQASICLVGGGRGGFVLLLVIILTIVLYSIKDLRKLLSVGLIAIFSVIVLFNIFSPFLEDTNIMRAFSIFSERGEDMDTERSLIYKTTINYISESPILGHGLFYQYDWCQKVLGQPYCHNIFLEILLQGGIVYFIIWFFIFVRFFLKTHTLINKDHVYSLLIPLVAYSFVMLMFSGSYLLTPLFWFVVLFVVGINKVKE